ncbi:MAG: hypothetical protein HUK18_07560 [Bacteroidales bacterium]|nr:hypothetical protein [Bacteroidales bacterium]
MGTKKFNINDIKKQIENADNDQLNDQYSEALTKNFDKVGELNRQVSELNTKVKNLTEKVTTLTDAAYTAVYTVENSLRLVISPQVEEKIRNSGKLICSSMVYGIDSKRVSLLEDIETKGNEIVTKIEDKGADICADIKKQAKSLTDDVEEKGKKIIERIYEDDGRVSIPPVIFISILLATFLMLIALVIIAYINLSILHSNDINIVLGCVGGGYAVFVALIAWLSQHSQE